MSRPNPTLHKAIRQKVPVRSRLLIAVSGGIDSISLLHALHALKGELSLFIEVAHIDHRLRANSAQDAEFVKELSESLALPFHLKRSEESPKPGDNVEGWGRKLRYGFLTKVRIERGLDWILTAHTANDVAETLLMRLISNKEPKSITDVEEQRRLLRPLLTVPRIEIENYAKANSLSFREDPTNSNTDFLRNRVRHLVLPMLESEFDKRVVESLAERAGAIQEDIETLSALCEAPLSRINLHPTGSKEWLRAAKLELSLLSDGLTWRLAELLVKKQVGFNVGRAKGRELVELFMQERQGVELPGGVSMRLHAGGVTISSTPQVE